jgi:hypothetical protein
VQFVEACGICSLSLCPACRHLQVTLRLSKQASASPSIHETFLCGSEVISTSGPSTPQSSSARAQHATTKTTPMASTIAEHLHMHSIRPSVLCSVMYNNTKTWQRAPDGASEYAMAFRLASFDDKFLKLRTGSRRRGSKRSVGRAWSCY